MKNFWRMIRYLGYYKKYAFLNIFYNLLSIVFSLVSLVMVVPFLRLLFNIQPLVHTAPSVSLSAAWVGDYFNYMVSQVILQYGQSNALLFVCGIVLLVFFLKNLFRYLAAHYAAPLRNGIVRKIRSQVYKKMLELPVPYFTEERKGDIITRLTADVQEIETSIMSVLEVAFREPLTIFVFLGAMLIISPTLTLFVLVVLPLSGIIIGRVGRSLRKQSHWAQQRLGSILSLIDETIVGLRIVKGFTAEERQTAKFEAENEQYYQIATQMARRRDLSSPLSEFLSIAVVALVLYVGGQMVLGGNTSLQAETFIAFMVIFSQMLTPAKGFANAYYNIQKGMASVDRVAELLDAPVAITEASDAVPLLDFKRDIVFENVGFSYNKHTTTLQDINFVLQKGKRMALVGASGAGKSTIADLLPRFYDVTLGHIAIDGVDIRQYRIADLRQHIGIVTQQAILFNDTVYNNIAFGKPNASFEEVEQAARIANAHVFIERLPLGYQTNIGDGGIKLSGGERQRLTIARAVLKNPAILILDEATSALDSASEQLVQQALEKLLQNRTSIVIAHRLSTIQNADEILVLDKGRIVERGTHQTLLSSKGVYQQLVALQTMSRDIQEIS